MPAAGRNPYSSRNNQRASSGLRPARRRRSGALTNGVGINNITEDSDDSATTIGDTPPLLWLWLWSPWPNGCLQQIAANRFSTPQDVIAILLQGFVLAALLSKPLSNPERITTSVNHSRDHHNSVAQAVEDAERKPL
jgi:hypothetical protein